MIMNNRYLTNQLMLVQGGTRFGLVPRLAEIYQSEGAVQRVRSVPQLSRRVEASHYAVNLLLEFGLALLLAANETATDEFPVKSVNPAPALLVPLPRLLARVLLLVGVKFGGPLRLLRIGTRVETLEAEGEAAGLVGTWGRAARLGGQILAVHQAAYAGVSWRGVRRTNYPVRPCI